MQVQPTLQGVQAVQALLDATPETPTYMIGIQENKITKVPLLEAVAQVSYYIISHRTLPASSLRLT